MANTHLWTRDHSPRQLAALPCRTTARIGQRALDRELEADLNRLFSPCR